jgi:hypothetical protein
LINLVIGANLLFKSGKYSCIDVVFSADFFNACILDVLAHNSDASIFNLDGCAVSTLLITGITSLIFPRIVGSGLASFPYCLALVVASSCASLNHSYSVLRLFALGACLSMNSLTYFLSGAKAFDTSAALTSQDLEYKLKLSSICLLSL